MDMYKNILKKFRNEERKKERVSVWEMERRKRDWYCGGGEKEVKILNENDFLKCFSNNDK